MLAAGLIVHDAHRDVTDKQNGKQGITDPLLHLIFFLVIECVFTTLQYKQIKRNIILGGNFVELFKQGFRETNRARNISGFKLFIDFKHNIHPHYNIMLKNSYIYITINDCIFRKNAVFLYHSGVKLW